MPIYFKMK